MYLAKLYNFPSNSKNSGHIPGNIKYFCVENVSMTAIIIISVFPSALYLLILKALDSFALVRFKLIVRNILSGMICCATAFVVTLLLNLDFDTAIGGVSFMPLVEEILKACLLTVLIIKKKIRFLAQCLIYGAAVGSGFSLLENIIYFYYNPDIALGTVIARGFGCSILHIGCTALSVSLMLLISREFSNLTGIIFSLVPSVAIHLIYNRVMMNGLVDPLNNVVWISCTFVALFLFIFIWEEKHINNQMEISMAGDINTLSALRSGDFSSAKSGEYLLDAKIAFPPEVFSAMVCYLQLALEVRISKQSDMLLHQAGLPNENAGKRHEERNAKKKEMKALARKIGKTGMVVLAPLLRN